MGSNNIKLKGQEGQPLSATECRFCHIEDASAEGVQSIAEIGIHIVEMENRR